MYLWLKVFHVFFVIGWMAGLFYLPRIFVHFQYGKQEGSSVDRLPYMAQKLFSFMNIIGVLALSTGVGLIWFVGFKAIWIHIKITIVLFLIIYHIICGAYLQKMKLGTLSGSHQFFRFFNEIPLIFMFVILVMVIFKPNNLAGLFAIFGLGN